MPQIWVARLFISDRTAHKISTKHRIQPDEVSDALICKSGLMYTWNHHPRRGRRAYVRARIGNRWWLAVLYPARSGEEDVWHLGSIYPVN